MSQNISIIGLGKLGSCMLAAYASKGHNVIGVDINEDIVAQINKGQAPVRETDLQKVISGNKIRIQATADFKKAVADSSISFIIVPTPSAPSGDFSVDFVISAVRKIGEALKSINRYHLIVLTSTVLPHDCDSKIIPALEQSSGKKCGVDFGFCYNPEFIAIGSIIRDLLNPDFLLIGEFDKKSGDVLEKFYSFSTDNNAVIKRMNIAEAELTKISLNHFITMKITFANMLAEIASKIPGVHVDRITDALGSDSRIGKKYLKGGLGFGGPCFPRDNRAFAYVAGKRGVQAPFAQSTDIYNLSIIDKMADFIMENSNPSSRIGIVGLSYKPCTGFCEESQGLLIAKKLAGKNYEVNVFEKNGHYHARTLLNELVNYYEDMDALLENSDIVLLTNLDDDNQIIKEKKLNKNIVLIDPWRQFDENDFSDEIEYVPYGIGSNKKDN